MRRIWLTLSNWTRAQLNQLSQGPAKPSRKTGKPRVGQKQWCKLKQGLLSIKRSSRKAELHPIPTTSNKQTSIWYHKPLLLYASHCRLNIAIVSQDVSLVNPFATALHKACLGNGYDAISQKSDESLHSKGWMHLFVLKPAQKRIFSKSSEELLFSGWFTLLLWLRLLPDLQEGGQLE